VSVNFYAFGPFAGGEADGEGLHVGQIARGYRFLMRSHPEIGLTSLAAWMEFVRHQEVTVQSEGGHVYSPEMLEALVRSRTKEGVALKMRRILGRGRLGYHVDDEGVEFCSLDFC
jgi:hypothetical protein